MLGRGVPRCWILLSHSKNAARRVPTSFLLMTYFVFTVLEEF